MEKSPMTPEVKALHVENLQKATGLGVTEATMFLDNNRWNYERALIEAQKATKK